MHLGEMLCFTACLRVRMFLALYKVMFAWRNAAVCRVCQPRQALLEYGNAGSYRMSIHDNHCLQTEAVFSKICQYLKWWFDVRRSLPAGPLSLRRNLD